MKKMLLLSFVFLFFGLGLMPHALVAEELPPQVSPAQSGFVPLAPIPGLTSVTDQKSAANSANLAAFFNNLYKFLIGLAAVLAVIEIIWGGLEISTKDSVSQQSEGKERITNAILGLILVLSPVLVFSIINPNILDLSLNLPSLKLTVPETKNVAPTIINKGTMDVITGPGTTKIGTEDGIFLCRNDGNCEEQKALCKKETRLPPEVGCLTGSSFRPYDDYSSELRAYSCLTGKLVVKCVLTNFSS